MKREEIIEKIVKDWLIGCEGASVFEVLKDYLTTGFIGFENISNKELADCYSNPVHDDKREEISESDIVGSVADNTDEF